MPKPLKTLKIEVIIETDWTPRQAENEFEALLESALPESVLIRDIAVEEQ
jgi:hypothetical protein